jgi:thiol-disulfide isomerase/thioredoxin
MIQKHTYKMKCFQNSVKKIFIILVLSMFASCEHKEIVIKGNINNLPDGIIYLSKDKYSNKIDSVSSINGKFTFKHNLQNEPIYLALHHIDKKGVFRAISFPTNAKYNNSGYNSSTFLSDSIVLINGSFTDNTPMGMFVGNTKFVTTPEIKAGYQTNALFHTDGDLFDNINKDTYKKVASKIKEYSNSFHLLYQININRNSFTASQTQNLLSLFHGEIIDSETFKSLKDYNEKRFNKKKLVLPLLNDNNSKKTEILDTKFKKHLVVFWASWCGPCRQEIPALKKMYSKYKNDIEFVSISTDLNNPFWQKALEQENMSWKQLILNKKSKEYEPIEIFFQLNNSIPYIALVDNNMKVLKSHVGLMTDNEMEEFIKN